MSPKVASLFAGIPLLIAAAAFSAPAQAISVNGATVGAVAGANGVAIVNGSNDTKVSPVPVPAAVWLFGSALVGFIGVSRRTRV